MTINTIKDYLNKLFLEKEEMIECAIISLIAGQHMLVVGPPGAAKTNVIEELTRCITGARFFTIQLSDHTLPEDLFGPLSLPDLEQGIYKRILEDTLCDAEIAFLDEIFKAQRSGILKALLRIMNERRFKNGRDDIEVPLLSLFAASNEYPDPDEGLEALFDRFLIRIETDYIQEDANFLALLDMDDPDESRRPQVPLSTIRQLREAAKTVAIGAEIKQTILQIRNDLRKEGIMPSDRRFRQSLHLLKARALLEGRDSVEASDLDILRHVLWNVPEQKEAVAKVVRNYARDQVLEKIRDLFAEAKEIYQGAASGQADQIEVMQKLTRLERELQEIAKKHPARADKAHQAASNVAAFKNALKAQYLGVIG